MARFNTTLSIITVTGTTTLTYVLDKATILLTGTSGYTLTLSTPVPFPGSTQSIYNGTGGNVTISTPVGNFIGTGFTAASTQTIPNNSTYTVTSDGTNYVITNNEGGPISATTGAFSGTLTTNGTLAAASTVNLTPANANIAISPTGTGTVTISPVGALTVNPTAASTINNTSIGATTRAAGAFTTLGANSTTTLTGVISAATTTNNQTYSTTGAGVISITSGTTGSINNMTIGATTAASGAFTTATASNAPSAANHLTRKDYVDVEMAKAFYYSFV